MLAGATRRAADRRARELLDLLGLSDRLDTLARRLSGGQRQRLAIARAMANSPAVLLADEPTGALDTDGGADVLRLFTRLHESGQTIVLVTHDPVIAGAAQRVVSMRDGRVVDLAAARRCRREAWWAALRHEARRHGLRSLLLVAFVAVGGGVVALGVHRRAARRDGDRPDDGAGRPRHRGTAAQRPGVRLGAVRRAARRAHPATHSPSPTSTSSTTLTCTPTSPASARPPASPSKDVVAARRAAGRPGPRRRGHRSATRWRPTPTSPSATS